MLACPIFLGPLGSWARCSSLAPCRCVPQVNVVVMRGANDDELCDFVELTRDQPINVRFIEWMPFDGNVWRDSTMVPYREMLAAVRQRFPDLQRCQVRLCSFAIEQQPGVGLIYCAADCCCSCISCRGSDPPPCSNASCALHACSAARLLSYSRSTCLHALVVSSSGPQMMHDACVHGHLCALVGWLHGRHVWRQA